MDNQKRHEVVGTLDDVLFIFGSALRYGLGRQTYATGLISEFLIDNAGLLNEKWLVNLLESIKNYEDDRGHNRRICDDACDYQSWMQLKAALRGEYQNRHFGHGLDYYELDEHL